MNKGFERKREQRPRSSEEHRTRARRDGCRSLALGARRRAIIAPARVKTRLKKLSAGKSSMFFEHAAGAPASCCAAKFFHEQPSTAAGRFWPTSASCFVVYVLWQLTCTAEIGQFDDTIR